MPDAVAASEATPKRRSADDSSTRACAHDRQSQEVPEDSLPWGVSSPPRSRARGRGLRPPSARLEPARNPARRRRRTRDGTGGPTCSPHRERRDRLEGGLRRGPGRLGQADHRVDVRGVDRKGARKSPEQGVGLGERRRFELHRAELPPAGALLDPAAERLGHHLVPEADAEQGDAGRDARADERFGLEHRWRSFGHARRRPGDDPRRPALERRQGGIGSARRASPRGRSRHRPTTPGSTRGSRHDISGRPPGRCRRAG